MRYPFLRTVSQHFFNLIAVFLLLLLLGLPIFVSTNLLKLAKSGQLVLGATDVLDYGNLIKVETQSGPPEVIKIKYTAFFDHTTVYENVAYIKNQSQSPQQLTIFSKADEAASLFFNLKTGGQPTTYQLQPGQLVFTSLEVAPVASFEEQETEAQFLILSQ